MQRTGADRSRRAEKRVATTGKVLAQDLAGVSDMQAARQQSDPPSARDVRAGETILPADIALVKSSFDRIWPAAEHAAALFYQRLFEIAPHLRPLFRGDMAEQKQKFIATLALLVGSLDNMSDLLPRTGTLGRRHVLYGVEDSHYALVGQALLWVLERELGPDWTPATAAAWTRTYDMLSRYMIEQAGSLRGSSTS
jgi:hemoglobin-like flavoprotein